MIIEKDIDTIINALAQSWEKDTCHSNCVDNYDNTHKSTGQCAVSSLIINDYFGGAIQSGYIKELDIKHYWNVIDNEIIDTTYRQFDMQYEFIDIKNKTREEILSNEDTKRRYKLLKKRVSKFLKKELQVIELHDAFDKLQNIYGSKELDSIYGAGCISNPDICFIFMNPTGRNVASNRDWQGLKAQWLGTKNIWKLFNSVSLLDNDIYESIVKMNPNEWDYDFANKLYTNIKNKRVYITNLGKCTQDDASPLSNKVFRDYLELLEKEIDLIKPKVIIAFGNQVSSILLDEPISVSQCRGKYYSKVINNNEYKVYPIYYPVGQGMRNINLAIEDIFEIMKVSEIK